MNNIDHFISNLEYLTRENPAQFDEFRRDIAQDLRSFLAYIEELENPINRPEVESRLEALDDASFNAILNKYPRIVRNTDLGNIRREASALHREGVITELFYRLIPAPTGDAV